MRGGRRKELGPDGNACRELGPGWLLVSTMTDPDTISAFGGFSDEKLSLASDTYTT